METWESLKNRRSIRAFTPDPVPEEMLKRLILEAAIWAPTAGNAQTWRFIVVTDPKLLGKIKMVGPGILGNPPAVIVICQDLDEATKKGDRIAKDVLTWMDTAMAAENIMLAAHAEGLGTCAVLSFNETATQTLLQLPLNIVPQLLISIGIPKAPAKAPGRKLEVVWFNGYPAN